jgi:hypothetical protein
VRIDVPVRSTCAYFFIDPYDGRRDPWWGALWDHVMAVAPAELDWKHEPIQAHRVARPELTKDQKEGLLRFLRTAPQHEIEGHRTLERAVQLKPDDVPRLGLVYFAAP